MKKLLTLLLICAFAASCSNVGIGNLPEGTSEIELTFRCDCPPDSKVIFMADNAGVISDFSVNGKDVLLDNENYLYTAHDEERLAISNSGKVRLTIKGVTPETGFKWLKENGEEFHPEKVKVKVLNTVPRERMLRVVNYNIQNGMWNGQADNYDKFVAYMQQVDADVCIFCESQTIYHTGTKDKCEIAERYLPYKYKDHTKNVDPGYEPEGWLELAARFGHKYVQVGAHQDSYPVTVTSKYPVTLVQKLGGEEISHGGIHAQVTFAGETVNLVGFHTYPHAFSKEAVTPEERAKSKAENGGHKYREYEISLFMGRTVLNPEFASEKNWLVMGDTNCPSPLDEDHLKMGADNPQYLGHKYILAKTDLIDLQKTFSCPDDRDAFVPSTQSRRRIDLMYGSPAMAERMINAKTPYDDYTKGTIIPEIRFYDNSSDHLPNIMDFAF